MGWELRQRRFVHAAPDLHGIGARSTTDLGWVVVVDDEFLERNLLSAVVANDEFFERDLLLVFCERNLSLLEEEFFEWNLVLLLVLVLVNWLVVL